MTNILVKMFIKNKDDYKNPVVREKYGVLASIVGIICNVVLFAIKMLIGIIIGSISVMADAFNNLSDAASSIVSFVGVKLANRPSDEEHPFGHGRYEYIAAFVVAFLVLQVGFSCLESAVDKIRNPEAVSFSPILVGILIVSVLLKLWLGLFNRKLGGQIDSSVMKATATDAFGDMLVTTVTVISILVGHFSGWMIDGYMGLLVSLFVLYAGIGIIHETLEPLLGQPATRELYDSITSFVESFDGVVGTHDLIVHNYGPTNSMASIHAEVPVNCDLASTHEIIDRIEGRTQRELGIFLVIHMDPVEVDNQEVNQCREMVARIAKEVEETATIHDFRMVNGEKQVNLIFDLVLPHEYIGEKRNQLLHELRTRISQEDAKYQCVITVDHSFVNG